jgi:hypothetical protein
MRLAEVCSIEARVLQSGVIYIRDLKNHVANATAPSFGSSLRDGSFDAVDADDNARRD